jgi:hypothetical protein
MAYLKFIKDADLISSIDNIIAVVERAKELANKNLYSNVLDPFSAIFHGITHSLSYEDWISIEKTRQTQKTMQNCIGNFHQEILGNCYGWSDLGMGSVLDIVNDDKKVIAEIKNKYNTTKGNHKVELYDAIKSKINEPEYKNYTGYYVEIISSGKKQYDKPFTPSDNKQKGKHRPTNNKIRIIDGTTFYTMVTGRKNALLELYNIIPEIIKQRTNYHLPEIEIKKYSDLFKKAFSTE